MVDFLITYMRKDGTENKFKISENKLRGYDEDYDKFIGIISAQTYNLAEDFINTRVECPIDAVEEKFSDSNYKYLLSIEPIKK